jgi:WS/DGAT/MGAT family acyltransferase
MRTIPGRDAHFLYEEEPALPSHNHKLLLFDTAGLQRPFDAALVRAAVGPRVAQLEPLRRRVVSRPLGLGHAVWIDAGPPDLERHIRSFPVPAQSGPARLDEVVARLAERPLERASPLWELWVVEGMAGGVGAAVLKLHHALADGAGSCRILEHLLAEPAPDSNWPSLVAESVPPAATLALTGVREVAALIARALPVGARALRAGRATRRLRRTGAFTGARAFSAPAQSWNGRPTARRSFAFTSVAAAEVDAIAGAHGATRGEVLIAIVAGAVREYLSTRGGLPSQSLTATIPVSLRRRGDHEEWGNRVGWTFIELATEVEDPAARLTRVHDAMTGFRAHRDELDPSMWDELWDFYPLVRAAYRAGVLRGRLASRPTYGLTISVVPGPQRSLGIAGAPLTAIHSASVLTDDHGLNITTWGYGDRISIAAVSCPDLIGDLDALIGLVSASMRGLSDRGARQAV